MREVVVVGICGPSGSGKSVLAQYLAKEFKSPILPIHADMYFLKHSKARCCFGKKEKCPEMVESVDLAACARDVEQVVDTLRKADVVPSITLRACLDKAETVGKMMPAHKQIIIVEGFVLFAENAILDLCDHLIWMDCDKEICSQRRLRRNCNKNQRPLDSITDKEQQKWNAVYDHVWEHHLAYRPLFLASLSGKSATSLDCRGTQERVQGCAIEALQVFLQVFLDCEDHPDPGSVALEASNPDSLAHVADQTSRRRPVQRRWGRSLAQPQETSTTN